MSCFTANIPSIESLFAGAGAQKGSSLAYKIARISLVPKPASEGELETALSHGVCPLQQVSFLYREIMEAVFHWALTEVVTDLVLPDGSLHWALQVRPKPATPNLMRVGIANHPTELADAKSG